MRQRMDHQRHGRQLAATRQRARAGDGGGTAARLRSAWLPVLTLVCLALLVLMIGHEVWRPESTPADGSLPSTAASVLGAVPAPLPPSTDGEETPPAGDSAPIVKPPPLPAGPHAPIII